MHLPNNDRLSTNQFPDPRIVHVVGMNELDNLFLQQVIQLSLFDHPRIEVQHQRGNDISHL